MAYQLSSYAKIDVTSFDLSEQETAVAARLLSRLLRIPPGNNRPETLEKLDLACRLYAARRERRHFFPANLFTDPAWDMLLMLYCAQCKGESMSVSAVCYSTDVPTTTGLRWVTVLLESGMIVRRPHPTDGRSHVVELSPAGRAAMHDYLCRIFDRGLFVADRSCLEK